MVKPTSKRENLMQRLYKISTMGIILLCSLLAPAAFAKTDYWQMNMYQGVTPISKDMYNLHMTAIWVCVAIGVVVFSIMFYSLLVHRKSRGYKAKDFHENTRLEIVWTIIPFLILVGLAIPATTILIRQEDTADSDVTIKVVGYQWKWEYQYLDQGISYFSNLSTPYKQIANLEPKGEWYLLEVDKPVVVPINKKIRFLVTSNDVIHSWWVPELGIKRDAIPGFMHESWAKIDKPGTYRGQCAELCGINHAYMPIVVEAVTQEDFQKWVSETPKTPNPYVLSQAVVTQPEVEKPDEPLATPKQMTSEKLMALGKERYEVMCAACHKSDGRGMPPMFPALKGSSVTVGSPISRHINLILDGVPGTAMQSYRQQLTDEEIAAIVTYERNAWGNNTGDVIQPDEIFKLRHKEKIQPTLVKKAQSGGLR